MYFTSDIDFPRMENRVIDQSTLLSMNIAVISSGARLDPRAGEDNPVLQAESGQQEQAEAPVTSKKNAHVYVMVPECRVCLQLFASTKDLHNHLKTNPTQKKLFRKKRYNTIFPWVTQQGSQSRKCPTCAKDYVSFAQLDIHIEEKGHHRHGIIPRWAEDNAKADAYWARFEKRHGWL